MGRPIKDLAGMTFGRLTVIGLERVDHNAIWRCVCSCHDRNEINVPGSELTLGRRTSCGCVNPNRKDLTGMKFGRLTVVRYIGTRNRRYAIWRCVCDCSEKNEVDVISDNLTRGNTTSCGCYGREMSIKACTTHGMSGTREYDAICNKRRRDKKKILDSEWSINLDRVVRTFFNACVVCGSTDKMCVDHVCPLSKGYGLRADNAVLLCSRCNLIKYTKMPRELPDDMREKIEYASAAFWEYCANKGIIKGSVMLGGG